ncbi:hypothetical protein AB9F26_05090 [Falsihalocynthiibacter sp. BN13B15]|uniref:hypothetical protein n=1 Tax=Falsihalocynthiibacter sp. BN13B15 TaxID=3240871 RepID=UPI003510A096
MPSDRTFLLAAVAYLTALFSAISDDPEQLTDKERAEVIAEMRAARQIITNIIDAAEAAG